MPKPLPTAQIRNNDWANAGTKTAQLSWAEDELFFSLSQFSVALVCQTFCDKMVCVCVTQAHQNSVDKMKTTLHFTGKKGETNNSLCFVTI